MDLRDYIRDVPDFPKPGILFRDITPLLSHAPAFQYAVAELARVLRADGVQAIVAIESRGFIVGAPVAVALGIPFVPVRKPGKLPAQKRTVSYSLEYGSGQLELHSDALPRGARVAVVDDLLATGGTAQAAGALVESCGASVAVYAFMIELLGLNGRSKFGTTPVRTLLQY